MLSSHMADGARIVLDIPEDWICEDEGDDVLMCYHPDHSGTMRISTLRLEGAGEQAEPDEAVEDDEEDGIPIRTHFWQRNFFGQGNLTVIAVTFCYAVDNAEADDVRADLDVARATVAAMALTGD